MTGYYPYLIAALPVLYFAQSAPISAEQFLGLCRRFLSEGDMEILDACSLDGNYSPQAAHPTLKKWQEFDAGLRNELVKIRASRKQIDPQRYQRGERQAEAAVTHIAMNAYRDPSALAAEKTLDGARWHFLEEAAGGHYFDLDALIIYKLKLLILERWLRFALTDAASVIAELIPKG